jgi:hypothetical protein
MYLDTTTYYLQLKHHHLLLKHLRLPIKGDPPIMNTPFSTYKDQVSIAATTYITNTRKIIEDTTAKNKERQASIDAVSVYQEKLRLNEALPVMEKKIAHGYWEVVQEPILNFHSSGTLYRIKPEIEYRQYTINELTKLLGISVFRKSDAKICEITGCHYDQYHNVFCTLRVKSEFSYPETVQTLLSHYTFIDGRKCGVPK